MVFGSTQCEPGDKFFVILSFAATAIKDALWSGEDKGGEIDEGALIKTLNRIYVEANQKAASDSSIEEAARSKFASLEQAGFVILGPWRCSPIRLRDSNLILLCGIETDHQK